MTQLHIFTKNIKKMLKNVLFDEKKSYFSPLFEGHFFIA